MIYFYPNIKARKSTKKGIKQQTLFLGLAVLLKDGGKCLVSFCQDAGFSDFFSNGFQLFFVKFVKLQSRCFAVQRVNHHFPGAYAFDCIQPLGEVRFLAVVKSDAVLFAAEEHRLDNDFSVKTLQLAHYLLEIHWNGRFVDDVQHLLVAGIQFQNRIFDAFQGGADFRPHQLGGIGQTGDDGFGVVFVSQRNQSVDDFVEMRMQGRLAVAGEGDAVNGCALLLAGAQFVLDGLQNGLYRVVFAGGQAFLQSPAAFAVEAVERAYFHVGGQQVYAEGTA